MRQWVPSNTYIATWIGISMCGATPIPVEPDIETACLDSAEIEKSITKNTKAILVTHLYGHPCMMVDICSLAKKGGLKVISDGAQARGAEVNKIPVGTYGDATAWSFYPTKNLGALGDAGAVTTSNQKIKDSIETLRNYGSKERYINEVIGRNNRIEELRAGFLNLGLRNLKSNLEKRKELARRYLEGLDDLRQRGVVLSSVR